ncbi:MAG: response regulator, partial [Hyphomicrobium sp.]|nr:response regulator [Hyphomicrobium sp.]
MRILLIEDEMALGEAIRTRLSQDAHAVDLVGDFASAVDAVRSTAHELVLLDLNLPGGSGMSILTALRRSGDRRPVLIITAADQLSDRLAGLNAGADDYIVKPFHLDEL